MAEELGRIEKPEAESFKGLRKLYLVPLLFTGEDAPSEYKERFQRYWEQVNQHIANQESKVGGVNRIYHEHITFGGEEGIKVMEKLSPSSCQIIKEKCQNGAVLEATELLELTYECLDWERCLILGFLSQKVAQTVSENYLQSAKKRYEHIASRIDATLQANEVALLFIREGHMVQFPRDIEVFSVAPPALDEIHRWLRDRPLKSEESEPEAGDSQPEPKKDKAEGE
jgi:hypothetical protein